MKHPSGIVEHPATDDLGRAGAVGFWAADNVAEAHAKFGAAAAAQSNADLAVEDTRPAVQARHVATSGNRPPDPRALLTGETAGAR